MSANEIKNTVLMVLSTIGSIVSNALGGWDAVMVLLVGLMAADYITGVLVAAVWNRSGKTQTGALSSDAGFRGLVKKGVMLLVVWVAVLLDNAVGAHYIRTAVVLFFCGNEGLSLLENIGLMGIKYPPAFKKALESIRDKSEAQNE